MRRAQISMPCLASREPLWADLGAPQATVMIQDATCTPSAAYLQGLPPLVHLPAALAWPPRSTQLSMPADRL